jgi:DNA-binding XRE family transcriptional regulator
MAKGNHPVIDCRRVELDGTAYVILRESAFDYLCRKAGVRPPPPPAGAASPGAGLDLDSARLAQKLLRRRLAAGLSQAELARRAEIRPETLNRIERGRTTPDFATIRKLVLAMGAAERLRVRMEVSEPPATEDDDAIGK